MAFPGKSSVAPHEQSRREKYVIFIESAMCKVNQSQFVRLQSWYVGRQCCCQSCCGCYCRSPFVWGHRTQIPGKCFYSIRDTKNSIKLYFSSEIWTNEGLHTLRRANPSYPANFAMIGCLQVCYLESDRFLAMMGPP